MAGTKGATAENLSPACCIKQQKSIIWICQKTFFVGDDQRDLEAGTAAGCKTILVNDKSPLLEIVKREILHA